MNNFQGIQQLTTTRYIIASTYFSFTAETALQFDFLVTIIANAYKTSTIPNPFRKSVTCSDTIKKERVKRVKLISKLPASNK